MEEGSVRKQSLGHFDFLLWEWSRSLSTFHIINIHCQKSCSNFSRQDNTWAIFSTIEEHILICCTFLCLLAKEVSLKLKPSIQLPCLYCTSTCLLPFQGTARTCKCKTQSEMSQQSLGHFDFLKWEQSRSLSTFCIIKNTGRNHVQTSASRTILGPHFQL